MKTYWDYSEMERSQLTEDQIRALLDVELMSEGALKPKAPALTPISPSPLGERKKFFSVTGKGKYGHDTNLDVCFETMEQAAALLELKPFIRDYDYEVGSENNYAIEVIEGTIVPEELYSKEQINAYRSVMKERKAVMDNNARLTAEYSKACEASEKITNGVWGDWRKCMSKRNNLKTVVDTYCEYFTLTGDDSVLAMKFLGKAFDATTIDEARVWFPDQIAAWPECQDGPAHCPDPAPEPAE